MIAAKITNHSCISIEDTLLRNFVSLLSNFNTGIRQTIIIGMSICSEDMAHTTITVTFTFLWETIVEYFHGRQTAMYWCTDKHSKVSKYVVKNIHGRPLMTYDTLCTNSIFGKIMKFWKNRNVAEARKSVTLNCCIKVRKSPVFLFFKYHVYNVFTIWPLVT